MNKTKVYIITTPFAIEFGKGSTVTLTDPRELASCPSDKFFIEERFVNLPDGYTITETEPGNLCLYKGDVVCGLSVDGRGILVDGSTTTYNDKIRLEFV